MDYFSRLLPGATVLREIYHPVVSESGSAKNRAEADCVIIYDDHLFIIEVKAGAFTYTSPANDLPAYVKSLEALVGAPSKQGQRFLKYLESAGEVDIFDAATSASLQATQGRFCVCRLIGAVTLDPFTVNSQLKPSIGTKLELMLARCQSGPFRCQTCVYSDIFTGPLDFLHFVEQRMRAGRLTNFNLTTNWTTLGLYLEHRCLSN